MNKSIVLGVLLAGAFSLPLMLAGPAFAQYMGSGGDGSQEGGHPSMSLEATLEPVSYTHLTLPTILRV